MKVTLPIIILIAFVTSCTLPELHVNTDVPITFEKVVEQQDLPSFINVNAVGVSNDGGYVVVGQRTGFQGVDLGFWLRTDEDGNVLRERNFDAIQFLIAEANILNIIPVSDGYVVCGTSKPEDIELLRVEFINEGGDFVWKYQEDVQSIAYGLIQTSDNGILVVGEKNNNPIIIKLNSSGEIEWEDNLNIGTGRAKSIIKTGTNNYEILIYSLSDAKNKLVYLTLEGANINYEIVDIQTNPFFLLENDFIKLENGNYIFLDVLVTGDNASSTIEVLNNSLSEPISGSGIMAENIFIESLKPTRDGGAIACGWTFGFNTGAANAVLIKLDSEGVEEWREEYGLNLTEKAEAVIATPDGGFFVAGNETSMSMEDNIPGDIGIYLLKTDREGNVE